MMTGGRRRGAFTFRPGVGSSPSKVGCNAVSGLGKWTGRLLGGRVVRFMAPNDAVEIRVDGIRHIEPRIVVTMAGFEFFMNWDGAAYRCADRDRVRAFRSLCRAYAGTTLKITIERIA